MPLLRAASPRRLRPGIDLLFAGTLAWPCARVMKDARERGRPATFFDDVDFRGELGRGSDKGLGFPSGHVAVAFALAIVVFPYLSFRWRMTTVLLAAVVALSRLYFGAHFPLMPWEGPPWGSPSPRVSTSSWTSSSGATKAQKWAGPLTPPASSTAVGRRSVSVEARQGQRRPRSQMPASLPS